MVNPRVLITAGICLCAAFGYSLQLGQKAADDLTAGQQLPEEPEAPLELENITLTSASPDLPKAENAQGSAEPSCLFSVSSAAGAGAMVHLDVSAPCEPNARVSIHHSGMLFSARLNNAGTLSMEVPALKASGIFIVETEAGQAEVILQPVTDLDLVERVALQWRGNSGFELHAREFGADYGAQGHVWHGSSDGAGRIYQLGDNDMDTPELVEIYTLPLTALTASGDIALSVEAEITALNCDSSISAQVLDLRAGALTIRDLVLDMPDCGATGDFLVLNNLVENLTIAQN